MADFDKPDIAIIGGGFAGLSAASVLAERGLRVTVLERKPALGGRAYSFVDSASGELVDNGQHVLMGCYGSTLEFLRRIGTYDQLVFLRNLEIQMLAAGGISARVKTAPLPGPLHMAGAVLGYRHLSLSDRLNVLTGGLRLLKMRRFNRAELEGTTVEALMDRIGQSKEARRSFWYPVAIATLNEEPSLASAALFAEVLKQAFFARRADSAFVYSRVGLSQLYCDAAVKFLEARGSVVLTHCGVERLEFDGNGVVARLRLRDGGAVEASAYISAVPFGPLMQMLPEGAAADPFFAPITGLTYSPIICVHAWLDREITEAAFVGFIGTTTQWLFNKRKIFGTDPEHAGGYLSFVISGARALVERSNDELINQVTTDLRTMVPAARDARLVKALVLKEKQATMAPDLGSHRRRPPVKTPIPNLFLAGDWVQTFLPATIESAVRSGHDAANAAAALANRLR